MGYDESDFYNEGTGGPCSVCNEWDDYGDRCEHCNKFVCDRCRVCAEHAKNPPDYSANERRCELCGKGNPRLLISTPYGTSCQDCEGMT